MKQVLQDLKGGDTFIADVPRPRAIANHVVVQTRASLISPGTERMLREFGKGNLISKALQQPDKVRQAYQKIRTDGLIPTYQAISNKLDQLLPLGYCNAGVVSEAGNDSRWKNGQRIVSNGYHAEYVLAPENLCAKIPDNVSDEEASFAITGAIAMQGVRLANPQIGETFVVMGLGLIGLLTVQILKANGCRVIGIDVDDERLKIAESFGAEIPTNEIEIDGVLIAASTKSDALISQAAQMCRKRGRIILLGVVGLNISRADFYEKEITFQVSCSYGPGRYDPNYELGEDYPAGFVRWTAQRNIEAVLELIASGHIDVKPVISHRFKLAEASLAYKLIEGVEPSLGVVLEYPNLQALPCPQKSHNIISCRKTPATGNSLNIAFIGAGNYATSVLAPAFSKAGANLQYAISQRGLSAYNIARKHKFENCATDANQAFTNEKIDTVIIATRHDSHADLVVKALEKGKHVFVEKPLALSMKQIEKIEKAIAKYSGEKIPILMVGFNRRFSPLVQKMKPMLDATNAPKSMVMTVNAGAVGRKHWTQDTDIGGGRIVGEACHFIDLLRHLCGHGIEHISANGMQCNNGDTATINLQFADGSIGTIHYFANGHKFISKERLEVFFDGKIIKLDNFRTLKTHGLKGARSKHLLRQNKGHQECVNAFCCAVVDVSFPIPLEEIFEISRATIKAADCIRIGAQA